MFFRYSYCEAWLGITDAVCFKPAFAVFTMRIYLVSFIWQGHFAILMHEYQTLRNDLQPAP